MTYHAVQAALCGCISIVIPDPGVTKEEWIHNNPLQKYGITYGLDDIKWALNTRHLVRKNLTEKNQETIVLVKTYIKKCYEHIYK